LDKFGELQLLVMLTYVKLSGILNSELMELMLPVKLDNELALTFVQLFSDELFFGFPVMTKLQLSCSKF
jgi:hypothetical protein